MVLQVAAAWERTTPEGHRLSDQIALWSRWTRPLQMTAESRLVGKMLDQKLAPFQTLDAQVHWSGALVTDEPISGR